jgi:hypothetical protein
VPIAISLELYFGVLFRVNPEEGGRQQPHQSLEKFNSTKEEGSATRWWHCPFRECSSEAILF